MALRTVPPTVNYDAPGSSTRRAPGRSFAELYRQARLASGNDNGSQNNNRSGTASNDDTGQTDTAGNRAYIAKLHDSVDTLRGELLVRVIQSGADLTTQPAATGDISRLATRLDKLRQKLDAEETRLSGKLFNVEV